MSNPSVCNLSPADVDCSGPWLLHPESPAEKLIPSLKKHGQLVPVLAVEESGKTLLVAGRARVAAASKLGMDVLVRYIDAADDTEKAVLHLEENSARLTDESLKLSAVRFFAARMDVAELPKTVAPLLGIKPKSRDMKFWLDWMELEPEYDELLRRGHIPLAAVSVLIKLGETDRAALVRFFEKLSWSRSNAVNFLTWLYETSRRENKSVVELISAPAFPAFESAGESESPKDAVTRFCKAAKELRYPTLSELEKVHNKIVSEICAGTKWRVEPVGSFETGEVLIQTRFKSREMMQKAMEDLESIAKFSGWEDLFELGRDK
ncbi:ParB N-terminal domain-containing protein [Maridesulfovibrio salexigens]|uniref:ParB domain protein nuclease n=1 Tax=Maridesulfovibrio salexigens (strain ATCC 14822 / DSM 2638 / NCIMB 8403 / VKM B-1763) TaxID=526222 RepID=C6C1T8_MARSD|nr:ParB N-terminal domain-containing protein [Maridesulfovibrio salexigens]ACS79334.1 ParB domain protein nuclease [Maridesulfovibrio salexigens DSM 2638]